MIDVKPDFNEIVFVLDRSGSMSGLENDTIGGYNSFLKQQKQSGTKAVISTVLFDHEIQILHDRLPISDIKELTAKDYQPRGCTALLDAVGGSVSHIHKLHKFDDFYNNIKQLSSAISTSCTKSWLLQTAPLKQS